MAISLPPVVVSAFGRRAPPGIDLTLFFPPVYFTPSGIRQRPAARPAARALRFPSCTQDRTSPGRRILAVCLQIPSSDLLTRGICRIFGFGEPFHQVASSSSTRAGAWRRLINRRVPSSITARPRETNSWAFFTEVYLDPPGAGLVMKTVLVIGDVLGTLLA